MAMSSFNSFILSTTTIFIALLHLLSLASCFHPQLSQDTTPGLYFEGKTRLGSTPPSCHNRCNQCHPCMAVQVPTQDTQPSHKRVQPGLDRVIPMDYYDSPTGSRYSNYKPLGWKCRCNDNFYNP